MLRNTEAKVDLRRLKFSGPFAIAAILGGLHVIFVDTWLA